MFTLLSAKIYASTIGEAVIKYFVPLEMASIR